MIQRLSIANLDCLCSIAKTPGNIAYILYPMDLLADWIEQASLKYGVSIVVITGMDWQNVFSPWPAKGVPRGTEDFKGQSPEFLNLLQTTVTPAIESHIGMSEKPNRSLIGVSMSGLFALWQWMVCDTFHNIASLSGSFWYEGFLEWMQRLAIPPKTGRGYFLLGSKESKSNVWEFNTVGHNTDEIVTLLSDAGIKVEFQSVPGDHYSDPIPRLDRAFTSLFLS